ncbi:unnamed protein product [Boreogadus saida]
MSGAAPELYIGDDVVLSKASPGSREKMSKCGGGGRVREARERRSRTCSSLSSGLVECGRSLEHGRSQGEGLCQGPSAPWWLRAPCSQGNSAPWWLRAHLQQGAQQPLVAQG